MSSLEQAELVSLHGLLNDLSSLNENDEEDIELLGLYSAQIIDHIKLTDSGILIYLHSNKVITRDDMEKISSCDCNRDAFMELFSHIYRKSKDWYKIFLESLYKDKQLQLVELLDPKFLEKKKNLEANKKYVWHPRDNDIQENILEDSGEAYSSGDYASNNPENIEPNLFGSVEDQAKIQDKIGDNLMDTSSLPEKSYDDKELKEINTDKMNIDEPEHKRADEDGDKKTIELRDYQKDLCKEALQGQNVIICAPTGSGKTIVAINIIKEHLSKKFGIKKVAFLVNQVALAEQQFNLCKQYLNCRTERLTGDTQNNDKIPLGELLDCNEVIVLTAQILVDAIKEHVIKDVSAFSLIIFDECHHTKARHPYNQIMHMYMDIKLKNQLPGATNEMEVDELPPPVLPQIIGLTASVGVGKARKVSEASEHILTLCANLDTAKICTARAYEDDMRKFVNVPSLDIERCDKRENDVYHQTIVEIMQKIETDMQNSKFLLKKDEELEEFKKYLKPPGRKGHDSYTQWVAKLKRGIAAVNEHNARKFYVTCYKMLEIYNNALIINNDCRSIDSLTYIEEEFSKTITLNQSKNTQKELMEYYTDKKQKLQRLCDDPKNVNPKLEKLKKMIMDGFRENPDSRAIVFAKTLALVQKLKLWMEETPELKRLNLKPETVTGARASADKGGMTRNRQVEVLDYFKDGDAKIIIATSVAEEGLDITKCNLVIRYDHVTNEIAMVQSRGRARAEASKFKLVASDDANTARKEEMNLSREMMMKQALIDLEGKPEKEFKESILEYQKKAKSVRDMDKLIRNGRILKDDEFILRCFGCTDFACISTDIRTIRHSQYTVVDKSFKTRYITKDHKAPMEFHGFLKKSKIFCKSCNHDWGIEALYQNAEYPLIKIESFVIEDSDGKKTTIKKWKNIPFYVQEISDDDLRRRFLEASGNISDIDSEDEN
ncbi:antiviral innate immune response receptor RIG-I isoform X2 [Patella vulgata]|nr:antiviral innate immune response receptor RIG-I isoform X2 [Patella vulgata]